jgi:DNA-directed RNA polymerase specialized sigma24 family protein
MKNNHQFQLPVKLIYNFIYRMSGNEEVAGDLTEHVLLMGSGQDKYLNDHHQGPPQDFYYYNKETGHSADHTLDLLLLKQSWQGLKKYNGSWYSFQEHDPVQKLLLSLSPEVRCAVILRDMMSYSYGQIAMVLNKPEREIGRLISLGRQEITASTKKFKMTGRIG